MHIINNNGHNTIKKRGSIMMNKMSCKKICCCSGIAIMLVALHAYMIKKNIFCSKCCCDEYLYVNDEETYE